MKALTLIQTLMLLIIDGRKKIETRSWPTKVRGTVAIHAGKKVDREAAINNLAIIRISCQPVV